MTRAIAPKAATPKHKLIRDHVLAKIARGEWTPDRRIPSEHELMHQFDVSRMTVHHALKDLRRDGMLVRLQGSGTFVAPPSSHLTIFKVADIAQEIRERGNLHSAHLIDRMKRPASSTEAEVFQILPGVDIFHALVLHLEDGIPLEMEDRLVNPSVAPEFLSLDYQETTSVQYLMTLLPYPEGRHVVRAIEPSGSMRNLLRLQPGEPCLQMERTTWTKGETVTFVRLTHPGSRYELRGEIKPPI